MKGFTIIEILVAIIIVGILATLAINQYTPARERAVGREAVSTLRLIAAAERIYRMEIGGFYPPTTIPQPVTAAADINSNLRIMINETNWDYWLDSNGTNTFTATSNRITGTGCVYTLNENEVLTPSADCPQ
jgi:prepilin-type N-terminal cleavage/methylation domain-containing protein